MLSNEYLGNNIHKFTKQNGDTFELTEDEIQDSNLKGEMYKEQEIKLRNAYHEISKLNAIIYKLEDEIEEIKKLKN